MVDAKELRKGNWVESGGLYLEVQSIEDGGINIWTDFTGEMIEGYSFEILNPIILTKEILEKLGFEQEDKGDFKNWYRKRLWGEYFECRFDTESKYLSVGNRGEIIDKQKFQWVKSLHQLQNWWYYFTGKELEINL